MRDSIAKSVPAAFARALAGVTIAAAIGGCSLTGYQLVQNRVLVPGGQVQSVVVSCPAGKKMLGGGFNIETPDDVKVYSSNPADGHGNLSDHTWEVMVKNVGNSDRQTTAVGICANAQ